MAVVDANVLVLNLDFQPLNVCNVRRAVVLLSKQKATVIEQNGHVITSERLSFQSPSVIRLVYHIKRPRPVVKLTRKEILQRDDHTCQYCGKRGNDLTLDHVMPRHRGGQHTWDNVVAACRACNHRKGGKTIDEARFRLHRAPFEPRSDVYSLFTPYLADERNEAWRTYLFLGRN